MGGFSFHLSGLQIIKKPRNHIAPSGEMTWSLLRQSRALQISSLWATQWPWPLRRGDWRWKHGKEENLMLSPGIVNDHRSPSYSSGTAFGHWHSKFLVVSDFFQREFTKETNRKMVEHYTETCISWTPEPCRKWPADNRRFLQGCPCWRVCWNCARHNTEWPRQILPRCKKKKKITVEAVICARKCARMREDIKHIWLIPENGTTW